MSRILVIDDNELVGKMLQETLNESGYDVRVALDANHGYKEAVQFLPDLIVLDVMLPDVTGFDLCRVIKNHSELRTVPVIMITGSARSTEEKVKGFQLGIDDYLIKPFEMPEFLERVRAILRRTERRPTEPAPAPAAPMGEAPPQVSKSSERVPILTAISEALLNPFALPPKVSVPGISLVFVIAALALCLGSIVLSAGTDVSMALVGMFIVGLWGIAVAVLVMASSIVGIMISWKEGAGVISLAACPLLLKSAGALVTSLWTTLSPFYYSAGIPLFWVGAPAWLARADVFEAWSFFLVWSMVNRWPGSSRQKAWIVTLLVWGASVALVAAMGKAGS